MVCNVLHVVKCVSLLHVTNELSSNNASKPWHALLRSKYRRISDGNKTFLVRVRFRIFKKPGQFIMFLFREGELVARRHIWANSHSLCFCCNALVASRVETRDTSRKSVWETSGRCQEVDNDLSRAPPRDSSHYRAHLSCLSNHIGNYIGDAIFIAGTRRRYKYSEA